jgi:hypothetical protein
MRIGQLIPWTIALGLMLDATTRMIPIDIFSFRAWEVLSVAPGPTGPFEADRVYINPLTHGDLSSARRYSGLRQYRLEYFSTDHWGFRNTVSGSQDRPVRWLLIGDSFGVSSGVPDGNSLASQVARSSGEGVYNASASEPLPLNDIRFTSGRLGMKEGVVIYEFMERQEIPTVAGSGAERFFTNGPPPLERSFWERYQVWRKSVQVGRLSILARWGWEFIDAKVGATPSDASRRPVDIVSYELFNGRTMLFYKLDIDLAREPYREISPDYLVWLKSELEKLNLQLAVLLVPNKYSVYGALVKDRGAVLPGNLPLERFEDSLKATGVFVVNVTEALRKQAIADLPQNEYVYFLDDSHWNERGISVAAQALVEAWKAK